MVFTDINRPEKQRNIFWILQRRRFCKRKGKGRIDAYGKWDNKEKWFQTLSTGTRTRFSINKGCTADMAWVAEAYLNPFFHCPCCF